MPKSLEVKITPVRTSKVLSNLQTVFDKIVSGEEYNKDQVRNMVSVSNAMVKVLRFEFDLYRHFSNEDYKNTSNENDRN